MQEKKVNEIMDRICAEWEKKFGKENLNPLTIEATRDSLRMSPHEDGLMRVSVGFDGETHLVPYEDIILHGLKGEDVAKYPVEQKENKKNKKKGNITTGGG